MMISFQIEGVTELSRNLTGLEANMKDWSPEFKETGEYLKNFFSGPVFDSEGSVYGEAWAPLSPAYAVVKAKKYPGKGILEATGTMRNSFDMDAAAQYVRVFNTTDYFKYHQSIAPRYKLPRRAMMVLDENRKQDIVKIFHNGLQNHINRSGIKSLYK